MHRYELLFQNLPAGFRVLVREWEVYHRALSKALLRINREHRRRHSAFCYEDKTIVDFGSNRLEYSDWWEALPSTLLPDVDGKVAFREAAVYGVDPVCVCYFYQS